MRDAIDNLKFVVVTKPNHGVLCDTGEPVLVGCKISLLGVQYADCLEIPATEATQEAIDKTKRDLARIVLANAFTGGMERVNQGLSPVSPSNICQVCGEDVSASTVHPAWHLFERNHRLHFCKVEVVDGDERSVRVIQRKFYTTEEATQ